MKIAFFDSGIGGLSVLHHAMRVLPHEQFVFYADEDHVPYGVKTQEEVRGFVQEAFDFLLTREVKAIVVACNTATSVAVKEMRRRGIPCATGAGMLIEQAALNIEMWTGQKPDRSVMLKALEEALA